MAVSFYLFRVQHGCFDTPLEVVLIDYAVVLRLVDKHQPAKPGEIVRIRYVPVFCRPVS